MSHTTSSLIELTLTQYEETALVSFTPGHKLNPISIERIKSLTNLLLSLSTNTSIKAIVFYGGEGRSFSAGADLNQAYQFNGGEEVKTWIDCVNNLYIALLQLPQPLIAAIDGYCIGMGLQFALLCDYRIGTTKCELKMPEFCMGISCTYGGYILEKTVGRSVMQSMLFTCHGIKGAKAQELGLLHETHNSDKLLKMALDRAKTLASYPSTPIAYTKKLLNKSLILELNMEVLPAAKEAHTASFKTGESKPRISKIIH